MAFTAPTTRATDYLVTAAVWNAEHVDNFNTAVEHLVVRKSADQAVSTSTVQQADTHLLMPLGANEVWEFRFQLAVASSGTADISLSLNAPAGATLYCNMVWADTVGNFVFHDFSGTTFPTSAAVYFVPTALIGIPLSGTIYNGASAGNLALRWAQSAASGTTTIKANSTLWGVKLA